MSKRNKGAEKTPADAERVDENRQRDRLASLLGRLLYREWLRRQQMPQRGASKKLRKKKPPKKLSTNAPPS